MATQEQIPYKLYKTSVNGIPSVSLLPGTNTPHGYQEIDYAGLGAAAKEYGDYYKNWMKTFQDRGSTSDYNRMLGEYNTTYGGDEFYNSLSSGSFDVNKVAGLFGLNDKLDVLNQMGAGQTVGSGNVASYIDPFTGNTLTNVSLKTIEKIEKNKVDLAAGKIKQIAPGMFIPVGSPADVQLSGGDPLKATYSDPNFQAMADAENNRITTEKANALKFTGYVKEANNDTVYGVRADGSKVPLSYEDYIASGGPKDFSTTKVITSLNPSPSSDPAQKYLEEQVNTALGQGVDQATAKIVGQVNNLGNKEAATVSAAQTASEMKDFMGLDKLMKELETIRSDRKTLTDQILKAMEKSDAEKAAQLELDQLKASAGAGALMIEGQPIPMPFIVGQQREQSKMAELKISNAIANLERLSGERIDKVETLKFLYDASANDFSDAIEMYKLSAPENIFTDVDSQGNLVTVMQNPITGEIMRRNLGKVGDNKEWESNKQLSLQNPGNNPFFSVDGRTVINRQTGRAYESAEQAMADGVNADFGNVDWLSGDKAIMKNAVLGLMDKYWDGGILPTDSYDVALEKAKRSRIYVQQVTNSSGGGGGITQTQMNKITQANNSLVRGNDGYVNPNDYRKARDNFGDNTEFYNQFPIENYIAPGNRVGDLKPVRKV